MNARIPSLDGLRALSILLVLLGHLDGTRGFWRLNVPLDYANLGVRVFFVISGFLITGLLMRERDTHGTIDLKSFYIRRTLRIFPAYYALIAVVFVLWIMNMAKVGSSDLWHAATYTTNYHLTRRWELGHAWSLAVEEQFYLVWPVVFASFGLAGARRASLLWVAIVPIVRVILLALPNGTTPLQSHVGFSFETVSDAIAMGCVFALYREKLWSLSAYRRLHGGVWPLIILGIGGSASILGSLGSLVSPSVDFVLTGLHEFVGLTVVHATFAFAIDWAIRSTESPLFRLLNARVLVRIGTMSYSLYLWQQLFLNRNSTAWATAFPQNILLALLVAWLSFNYIETPALKLRGRLEGAIRRLASARGD